MSGNIIRQKIADGAKIVDVRSPDEFADGHYPGATNIPVNLVLSSLDKFGPKDHPLVLYCASGGRSAVAQKMLQAHGFTDVVNAGGLEDMPE